MSEKEDEERLTLKIASALSESERKEDDRMQWERLWRDLNLLSGQPLLSDGSRLRIAAMKAAVLERTK